MDIKRVFLLLLTCSSIILATSVFLPVTSADSNPTDSDLQKVSDDLLESSEEIEARILVEKESNADEPLEDVEQHIEEVDYVERTVTYERSHAIIVDVDASSVNWSDLASHDDIEFIYENERLTTPEPPEKESTIQPEFFPDVQYGIENIEADNAWDEFETEGDDIKVAVIDDGLDTNHPSIDLKNPEENHKGYWAVFTDEIEEDDSIDFEGENAPAPTDVEENSHGTHVSGTVVGGDETGTQIGVAPNATLMHASVFYNDSGGNSDDIINAIQWAVDNDADIITMSLGYPEYEGDGVFSFERDITQEIQAAQDQGAIFFSSAGNSGDGSASLPAADGESVAIGASTSGDDIASYSSGLEYEITDDNWGEYEVADEWESPLITPEFSAPGDSIYSAEADSTSITRMSGTSMASPHAAGSTALLLENNPELDPDDIYTAYEHTTTHAPEEQDTRYGHGIINTYEAIKVSKQDGYMGTVDTTENHTVVLGDTVLVEAKHKNKNIFDQQATRDVRLYINGTSVADEELSLNPEQEANTTIEYTVEDADVGEDIVLSTEDQNTTLSTQVSEPAKFEPTILEDELDDLLITDNQYTIPVEVENVGGVEGVGDLDLYVNESLEVDGDLNIPEVDPGETETIDLEYTTTEEDTPELNLTAKTEDHSSELITDVVEPATFSPSINTSNLEDGLVPDEETTIEAEIENIGDIEGDTTVDLYINESNKQSTQTDSIGSSENETVEFDYTPTEDDIPELNVTVKTPDETTEETVDVLVLAESELSITETNSPIESEDVEATVEIENIGETDLNQTLSIDIPELGENTTEIDLEPSEKNTETLNLSTDVGDNGEYTLEASTPNNTTDEQITIGQVGTFETEITDISDSVTIGENFSVEADITNVGDEQTTQEVVFSDNSSSAPFKTTSIELDAGDDTQIEAERETTLDDPETLSVTVSTDNDEVTDTLTVEPPEPPEINSLTVDEDRTNDVATITTDFDQGGVNVTSVETGLEANFTSFSETQTNDSDVSEGGTWETTVDAEDLPSDGNYTAVTTIEDEAGQIVDVEGESVEVDTTAPFVSLGLDELYTDPDAELSISADEDFTINSLEVNDSDANEIPTSPPSGLQSDTVVVEFDDDGHSEFDITVEIEDELGNSDTETMSGSVSDYTISEGGSQISTSDGSTHVEINVNESEVGEGEQRAAISSISDSLTTGTTASDDQIISSVFDMRDIGLDDNELDNATIRFSVDHLPAELTETFENDELQIMRSEKKESDYTPIETEYDSDTNELVATVDGFSQHGPGGEDNTPPSLDDTTITPGTEFEEEDGPVTATFEYSPDGTDINLSETYVEADDVDNEQITSNQVTDSEAEITVDGLENGDSFSIDLTVTDEAGNEKTKSVPIDVSETPSENGNDNDNGGSSSSSSGGGGGGGGGGGSGLPGISPSDINPPTGAEVETDAEGTIRAGEDESVVGFGTHLENPVAEQARFDRPDIDGEARTRDYDGITDEIESPPGNIVSISQVMMPPEFQDESARLILNVENAQHSELSSDDLNTDDLTVWRHTNGDWEPLETTAIDSIYIEAETPGFSYFAITDTDTYPESDSESESTEEQEDVDDSVPGFGLVTVLVALLTITGSKLYTRNLG